MARRTEALTLGPYRLLEELGAGGMGTVWRAEEDGRQVALKVIHPHLVGRRGFFQRFQREAQAGRNVDHPNVVRTLECDLLYVDDEPRPFLVMEYVEGRTLRQLLEDLHTVPEALVREIARQVAAGLEAIHAAGIVHRDLKPENVLITGDHRVRIMDLGVARHTERTTVLTQEGQFAGSLLYAAPEQLRGNEVGPAADLYALGVVLYELLSGVNPFRHDDPSAVIAAHLESEPERLDRRTSETTPFLSELVATLLAKRPAERLADATLLKDVLTNGERSAWWSVRERTILRERGQRLQVPVRRETKLYGREMELGLLRLSWEQAKDGRGNVLLLEGEAGIGKSRLVDALVSGLDGADAHVLYGSYPPSGGMGGVSDAILTKFGRADLEESLRPYLTITPSLVPAFAAVVKREAPPGGAAELQGDALHAVCVHFMRALAEEKPLLWVVEDLHFADRDSRMLLLSLARAVEGYPILLLATTRPGLPEAELAHFSRLGNFRRAGLGRLSAREVILLLQDAFRSESLAEKLGGKVALQSDGVPFFVFEMIRGLKEGQFVTQLPNGSWVESKLIEKIEVPPAVKDLVEARLRDLPREDRAILDIGSVLGFEFDPELVAAVRHLPCVHVLEVLGDIERRSSVVRASGNKYRFDHHQIQEVVYSHLSPRLRQEYHTLVAGAFAVRVQGELSGEDRYFLASHHVRGSRPKNALPHLLPALGHLEKSYRSEAAIELAGKALGLAGLLEGRDRVGVLMEKGGRHFLRGERDQHGAALYEALALADAGEDVLLRAKVRVGLGKHLRYTMAYDTAQECLEQAIDLARKAGDPGTEASATGNLGNLFLGQGRYEEARDHQERNLALSREIGDRQAEAYATGNLGTALAEQGHLKQAREEFEKSIALSRQIGSRHSEAKGMGNLGATLFLQGYHDEGRACIEQALGPLREIGDRRAEANAVGALGSVLCSQGRYEEARAHTEKHLALSREIGNLKGAAMALGNLGVLYSSQGRYEEARALYERGLALSREIRDRRGEGLANGRLGLLLSLQGRYGEARELVEEALALALEIGDQSGEGGALAVLADVADSEGETETALRLHGKVLALRRKLGEKGYEALCLVALGRIEGERGDHESAIAHLEEALALARETKSPGTILAATVERARLPGGDVEAVLAALEEHEERVEHAAKMNARFRLWELSTDKAHLVEAKRLLDFAVEQSSEDSRTSMLENVPLHRDIMQAWEEHGEKE